MGDTRPSALFIVSSVMIPAGKPLSLFALMPVVARAFTVTAAAPCDCSAGCC